MNNLPDAIPDVWKDIPYQNGYREGNYFHPQALNVEIVERIIDLCSAPGDLVVDAFCGSGTSALVAEKKKRRFIGVELNWNYALMGAHRLAAFKDQLSFNI